MNSRILESAHNPARALADAASQARALAGNALHSVGAAIDQGRARGAAQFDAGRDAAVDYVREKPLATVAAAAGIAALVGLVIGLLLFRR
jgi:ElaB/YqjD/DUF883 family membrane-anchored ribosome-binding protein